jgi:hypothetical protein
MLDILAKIYDEGGPLVSVACTLFEGDPRFIIAIELRFQLLSAVFRAVADDDTLAMSLGPLVPGPDETLIEAHKSAPWSACVGLSIRWAWQLTNHQGYNDGVRLEFSGPGQESGTIVELVVVASAIHTLVAVPSAAA